MLKKNIFENLIQKNLNTHFFQSKNLMTLHLIYTKLTSFLRKDYSKMYCAFLFSKQSHLEYIHAF